MTRYLISFDAHAMDHIPDEDMPAVLCDGRPLRKQNGMPFTLPFSPDTIRWRRAAIVELRKLGIDL